ASLVLLAEADAFLPSLGLERRDVLWAIKALRDEPLPLFAQSQPGMSIVQDHVMALSNLPEFDSGFLLFGNGS
ncbi:hypothetical protein ACEQ6C_39765, partial [Rhizobium ruizarguesonis]